MLRARLSACRRVLLVGNGGIATEFVYVVVEHRRPTVRAGLL